VNICAIFRNESLYLKEWIEFHQIVGVGKFTLYQNNSDDDYLSILQPYIDREVVELIQWPMARPSQQPAYQHYLDSHKEGWTAFIDCDEFLWSPRYATVQEAINSIPTNSAIGVNWMCFGSSNKQEWEDAPVIERFTWRPAAENGVNQHIKSIICLDQDVRVGSDPHFFQVPRGTFTENGEQIGGPLAGRHSSSILRINHYSAKSYGEWLKRSQLGKPDRPGMDIDPAWYWDRQAMDVEDREIQRFLPELKRRMGCA